MPRTKGSKNKPKTTNNYATQITEKHEQITMMILASPGQHSCNTRTHIPTTFGQAFLYYPDIHS